MEIALIFFVPAGCILVCVMVLAIGELVEWTRARKLDD